METLVLILIALHNLMILVTFLSQLSSTSFTNLALQKSLQIVFNHSQCLEFFCDCNILTEI